MLKDPKIYEPFEECKGLRKKRDPDDFSQWIDYAPAKALERYSYPYFVAGFENVCVVYDREEDKVVWLQSQESISLVKKGRFFIEKKGIKVWEAMPLAHRKLFLFNLDWFLNK